MRSFGWAIVLAGLLAGCGEEGERRALTPEAGSAPPAAAPAPAPASDPATEAAPAAPASRFAKVLEVLIAGDYTIARMDACGTEAWAAGPPTEMAIGQTVEMSGGMIMENFHSKTLDRTFDVILFVDWFRPTDQNIVCPEPPKDDPGPGKPGHGGGGALGKSAEGTKFTGKVAETMDSGGYTYVKLAACGKEQWFAGPPVPTKPGQTIVAVDGLEMTNFTSKTLGRVFPSITFVRALTHVQGEPKCE